MLNINQKVNIRAIYAHCGSPYATNDIYKSSFEWLTKKMYMLIGMCAFRQINHPFRCIGAMFYKHRIKR